MCCSIFSAIIRGIPWGFRLSTPFDDAFCLETHPLTTRNGRQAVISVRPLKSKDRIDRGYCFVV